MLSQNPLPFPVFHARHDEEELQSPTRGRSLPDGSNVSNAKSLQSRRLSRRLSKSPLSTMRVFCLTEH